MTCQVSKLDLSAGKYTKIDKLGFKTQHVIWAKHDLLTYQTLNSDMLTKGRTRCYRVLKPDMSTGKNIATNMSDFKIRHARGERDNSYMSDFEIKHARRKKIATIPSHVKIENPKCEGEGKKLRAKY